MPCPIRFGPGAEDDHGLAARAARPRSPRRRRSSGTASARRTRRHRCRRSCRPGGPRAPAGRRGRCPRACRGSGRSARRRSRAAWPSRKVASSSRSAAATCSATSLIRNSWSTNHGSIRVASKTCSGVAPARIASITLRSRPSCGTRIASSSSSRCAARSSPVSTRAEVEDRGLVLQRAQRLLQRLGEVAPDRHRLADRLHVGGQRRVGAGELLEREPRHLDHDVVQRRLERLAGRLRG